MSNIKIRKILWVSLLVLYCWPDSVDYSANRILFRGKKDMVILDGNAFVSKNGGEVTIHARKIEILNKKNDAIAYGNVLIQEKGMSNIFMADRVNFNYSNEIFIAEGSPKMINNENEIEILSKKISGNLKNNHFVAHKDVQLISKKTNESYRAYASNAEYFSKDDIAKLWGGVKLVSGTEGEVEVTSHQMDFLKKKKRFYFLIQTR